MLSLKSFFIIVLCYTAVLSQLVAQAKMENFSAINLTLGQMKVPDNTSLVSLGLSYTGSGLPYLNHQIGIHHLFSSGEESDVYGFIFFDLGTGYRMDGFRVTAFVGPAIVYTDSKPAGIGVVNTPRFGIGPNAKLGVSYNIIKNISLGAEYCYNWSRLGTLHGVLAVLMISNAK